MKNWLKFWKEGRTTDLEHSLLADRPKPPAQLVKAIMGDVRARPVRPQVRLGRALVGATALAALAVAVSFAAGLGATGGVRHSLGSISFKETSGANQYDVAPVITSFAPGSGVVGDTVTLTGTGFLDPDNAETVSFNGTPATFTIVNDTQIHATVPSGATTGPITVQNSAGSASSAGSFTVFQVPTITSLSKTSGSVGDQVDITGTGFTGTTAVAFNGTAAAFTINSDTSITTHVPTNATDGTIAVTNPAGSATSATFTIAPSTITFSPTSGTTGQVVVITGKYFTGATAVKFNGTNAGSFHVDSDTQITAVVGAGSTSGPVSITTPDGTGASASNFTILATPVVSSFAPGSGGPGSSVTITGSHFTGATTVKFHGTAATSFTVNSDTQITATVPNTATSGQISVTNSQGTGTSAGSFTVLALPNIASFSPTSGPVGTSVTINGSKFTGASSVTFNGTPAVSVNVNADNKITATVPSGATTGPIAVTTAAGTRTSSGTFTVIQTPTISSFNPASSGDNGSVTVLGSGFTGTTSVKLGATAATFTVNSDAQLTLKVPATLATGSYTITVTNAAGFVNSATQLVVGTLTAPSIGSFSPASGPSNAQHQTPVTINGSGFTGTSSVTFNGKPATNVVVVNDGQITAMSPVGATTGKIAVTNAKGTALSATSFTVVQPPTVISFSPTSGRPTVTAVTISGINLTGPGTLGVSFNGTPATSIPVHTATQIQAVVPAGATTGHITVSDSGIGTATSSATFIVVSTPTITAFSPIAGKGGTVVTVTGSGFLGGSTPTVSFNGTNGTGVHVLSDSALTVSAPPSPPAASGTLTVTNDAGTSAASAASFTYQSAPTIASFNPTHGPANPSMTTPVDILGSNFTAATNVSFNGKAASAFTVVSAGEITTFAPIGATTGKITVTTPSGTGSSATPFTVDPAPVVTGFSPKPPAGALVGAAVTINGSGFVNGDPMHVSFNGTNQPAITIVSPTEITTHVPSGATTGPITVSDDKTGSGTSAASFIVIQNPTIASFTPGSGIVGTRVTVLGSGFAGGTTTVRFNGTLANAVTINSDTSLTASVPSGATSGLISISNATLNTATSVDTFFVANRPTISTFDPVSGPGSAMASTVVDIGGSNFNGTTAVLFDGTPSQFVTVDDNNDITALVPAGAKSGKITVVNPAGQAVSSSVFTVDPAPSISSITPTKGATGDVVTINGNGLVGELDGTPAPNNTTVDFVNAPGAVVDSITTTRITVEVPSGALTGPLVVTNVWGEIATSPVFSVIQTPQITNISDEFLGGTNSHVGDPVEISGAGFTGTTAVSFNGTPATSFAVVSDTLIIARVPRGATTGTISVTNEAGSDTSAGSLTIS